MTSGREDLESLVAAALAEDLGDGDVTTDATVPADARARARIVQKQPGVVFGLDAAAEAFRQTGAGGLDKLIVEGTWTRAGAAPRSRCSPAPRGRCSPASGSPSTCSATCPASRR